MNTDYKYIIFDADDTLVDYIEDSLRSFRAALRSLEREGDEEVLRTFFAFDFGNWEKIGLSDVHLPEIQAAYHDLYRIHCRDIFLHAEKVHGLGGRAEVAEQVFLEEFSRPGQEVAGAREVVATLKKKYRVYAATNGLTSLQRSRLAEFDLDGVFISEEIGTIKPNIAFFEHMLQVLGATPKECLMVGDSLSSDIAGANGAGMDCIWFNPKRRPLPGEVNILAQIHRLEELLEILA